MPLTWSKMDGNDPIKKPAKIQIRTNIKCSNAKENKMIQGITAQTIPNKMGIKTKMA